MLFTRWINSVLQRSKRAGSNLRGYRALGTTLIAGSLSLAACGEPADDAALVEETSTQSAFERSAIVTSVFNRSAPAKSLSFIPNSERPWTGLLLASLEDGGFDVFNIDGMPVISAAGPQLNGIAVAPEFALRGEVFPLVFGADSDGAVRGFALITQAEDIVELPLEGELPGDIESVCHFQTGIGFVDLALLTRDSRAFIVRVQDGGGVGLEVTTRHEFNLPFSGEYCAADFDALLISSPTAGIARMNLEGETLISRSVLGVEDIALSEMVGRTYLVSVSSVDGLVSVLNADTLESIAAIRFEDGINAAGFARPETLTISDVSYGGMSYSSGLFAVYDRADNRIKIVAREVLSRAALD